MKNGVFWDVTPCGSCKNRRFGGTQRLHHQGKIIELGTTVAVTSNRRMLRRNIKGIWYVFAIHVALMKEALSSSETSVLTRATWRKIREDTIFHSHLRENLKSYKSKSLLVKTDKSSGHCM
jgi:hypothetical protein